MRLRYKLLVFVLLCVGLFLYGRCSKPLYPIHQPIILLPKGETERIIVDPGSHTIMIQTLQGIKTETLPDRPSVFDVNANGTVKVSISQFGWERHLFISGLFADKARLGIGGDFFYFKRLDLGAGVADQIGMYTPIVFAKLTYNFKGNMQAGLVYQSNKYVGGILAVRLF